MMSVALCPRMSASAVGLPLTTSGSEKSGAAVPSGSMLDGVRAIMYSPIESEVTEYSENILHS